MYTLFVILIVVAAVLMIGIVLIQESKGGGLASGFAGANSVVGGSVEPYTLVAGNPARPLQKRFDDALIELLLQFKWWDRSIEEINALIPILTCGDLERVRAELAKIH